MNQTSASTESVLSASRTPQDLVAMTYRLISFSACGEPAWAAFRELFSDRAVLALRILPEDSSITVMNLDEYVQWQIRDGMKEAGYEERPLDRSFNVIGDLAEAHVRFQMYVGARHIGDAIDIFQIVRVNGRWLIVSIVSEVFKDQSTS
jgi:hypothetical protein